ncbi:MAG: YgiQ family radical SAM protein [Deltaproteobacteria bacterium]|nr:YgiQ family radical SAM protein [Deltaproteobacteria bacterium]
MFLPTTPEEVESLGWQGLDVVLVTGDSYVDSPFIGAAVIGKLLLHQGYRVGVIAQPDIQSRSDIARLGEPLLFWGVTSGSVDSMVANYTATGKRRKHDDYTPGGLNTRRPDRAIIVYSNLIRRFFKSTVPIVLGGIEASLRRIPHYDCWSNAIRRSILFDAKADILIYGMGEKAVLSLADKLKRRESFTETCGICYIAGSARPDCIEMEPFEKVSADPQSFSRMFHLFYQNNDPVTAKGLCQKHGSRYLIHMPPCLPLSQPEMDAVHDLDYERELHPFYRKLGDVRALETIRFSVSTHRGCYGECSFCAIAVHQGRTVQWRSQASILREVKAMAAHPAFKGIISDVGGPTANMYGFECRKKQARGACTDKRCLYPVICDQLKADHRHQIDLLKAIREIKAVRHVFVASGIRYDLILSDQKNGLRYLTDVVQHHTSGQMKIAPEHTENDVLDLMGKPGMESLIEFKRLFDSVCNTSGKQLYLTYYFMAAHPGCTEAHMSRLKAFVSRHLHLIPEQVQIFTPTPSTISTLVYHTGVHPVSGAPVFCEKQLRKKEKQKQMLLKRS